MSTSTKISKARWNIQEIEFILISAWLLLFPKKDAWLYYLVFAAAAAAFSLRRLIRIRNISKNAFSLFLLAFNLIVIGASFFSPYPWKSLVFAADLLLISIFYTCWESPIVNPARLQLLLGIIISFSSAVNLLYFLFHFKRLLHSQPQVSLFFTNPILQGIASGTAVIIFLYLALDRFQLHSFTLLLLNAAGMVVTGSKAAFLGAVFISLYLVLIKKRALIKYLAAFLILIIVIPNPLRKMTLHSLQKDPYAFDRPLIWKMSLKMLGQHLWTGVGPAMFAETARRHNFPQEKGDSRYGKAPESPHSDYFKVAVETGIAGLAALIVLLIMVSRKILRPPLAELAKLITAFFLFQSVIFNYIFEPFFLFAFFFTLKWLLEERSTYFSPAAPVKLAFGGLLLAIFLLVNLLPTIADSLCRKALSTANPEQALRLLQRAETLHPADDQIPFLKGAIALGYFQARNNLQAATDAIAYFRQSQRLNPFNFPAYFRESEVFQAIKEKGRSYPGLEEEIIDPLGRGELLDPFNPFLKFQKALVHWQSGSLSKAEACARQAIGLEPDFVSALYFLHQNFGYLKEGTAFSERIAAIQKKIGKRKFKADSYLDKLFESPAAARRMDNPETYSTSASTRSSK